MEPEPSSSIFECFDNRSCAIKHGVQPEQNIIPGAERTGGFVDAYLKHRAAFHLHLYDFFWPNQVELCDLALVLQFVTTEPTNILNSMALTSGKERKVSGIDQRTNNVQTSMAISNGPLMQNSEYPSEANATKIGWAGFCAVGLYRFENNFPVRIDTENIFHNRIEVVWIITDRKLNGFLVLGQHIRRALLGAAKDSPIQRGSDVIKHLSKFQRELNGNLGKGMDNNGGYFPFAFVIEPNCRGVFTLEILPFRYKGIGFVVRPIDSLPARVEADSVDSHWIDLR
jgi:hypothetical protein